VEYQPEEPRIRRPFKNLNDFIGMFPRFQLNLQSIHFVFIFQAEEILVLMLISPIVFFGLIDPILFWSLVGASKIYLSLIYRVDKVNKQQQTTTNNNEQQRTITNNNEQRTTNKIIQANVKEWSSEALEMAGTVHDNLNWDSVTLNWHLVRSFGVATIFH